MKVENLDLYYGKFKALKNINLDIPENPVLFRQYLHKLHLDLLRILRLRKS